MSAATPYGLAEHDAAAVRSCDPFAEVSLALFGVVVEHIRRGEDLHLCVLEGLALLQRQKPGDLLRSLPNQPGRLVQHLRPLWLGVPDQTGKAFLAACKARRASWRVPTATSATGSWLAGL